MNSYNFRKTVKDEVISGLIATKDLYEGNSGICDQVDVILNDTYLLHYKDKCDYLFFTVYSELFNMLDCGFRAWPKFSGDICFPVSSTSQVAPCKEFDWWFDRSLWERNEYGDLRRELAVFLVEYFKENLWPEYDNEQT